ncbi:hypothetical protein N1851_003769 [Merluccius polli]|uniref:Uncharacterized protein n=1 Tax=Merluccius polli TaxID=89951 RepID=A0AA47PA78_MERPO|nr:hypothetical protein N1851_003769 [Merluccius polli]
MMAKMLLQELCRKNLGWDEAIPHVLSKQWADWLEDLQKVAEFKIDRCIKPKDFSNPVTAQLHHFSDASEVGYGTVSYLRLEKNSKVHVAFMMGKARVVPLKQTTIPRLELTAAVLAVRVDSMLQKELQLKLEKSVFWTDSTTVCGARRVQSLNTCAMKAGDSIPLWLIGSQSSERQLRLISGGM